MNRWPTATVYIADYKDVATVRTDEELRNNPSVPRVNLLYGIVRYTIGKLYDRNVRYN